LCFPIVIKSENIKRSKITAYLENCGIETRPMFSCIPIQEKAYQYLGYEERQFPNATYIGNHGFYIGCHQNINDRDIEFICDTFASFFDKINSH
jgi:dTDP-4-amino-4,6-dideoxygalactose transaminase